MIKKVFAAVLVCLPLAIAGQSQIKIVPADGNRSRQICLPTGVCLDPAGRSFAVGNMPLSMVLSPEGDRLLVLLSGWRQQGLQVVDPKTGQVTLTLPQPGRRRQFQSHPLERYERSTAVSADETGSDAGDCAGAVN